MLSKVDFVAHHRINSQYLFRIARREIRKMNRTSAVQYGYPIQQNLELLNTKGFMVSVEGYFPRPWLWETLCGKSKLT